MSPGYNQCSRRFTARVQNLCVYGAKCFIHCALQNSAAVQLTRKNRMMAAKASVFTCIQCFVTCGPTSLFSMGFTGCGVGAGANNS